MFNSQKGFTLIELLIVLTIMISALSVMSVNISSGNDSQEVKAASRDLKSALRYARGQALVSQQEMTVMLDLETDTYRVSSRNKTYSLAKGIGITLKSGQDEIQTNQKGQIRFFPDGSSTGGQITVEKNDIKWQVNINWLTGHVAIDAG